ncbi:MAG: YjjG family noncanonical pyrimidine nucleotidase [Alistipes sp.]|nr:YjjG family noncanonical pyrimidine nucleotidase [Alistipes sp.]
MGRYQSLFFDLDRTIWDVERNQKEALAQLYDQYDLKRSGVDFEPCFAIFDQINTQLWAAYRDELVTRVELRNRRFAQMLLQIGLPDPHLAVELSDAYVALAPTFRNMIPYATEVVTALHQRYPLYILTNGFRETQHLKLHHSGLTDLFRGIICSEDAGANKPSPRIYTYAMEQAGVEVTRAVMIGDDLESDIQGAFNVGMDSIWFNPTGERSSEMPTHEIADLRDLLKLL